MLAARSIVKKDRKKSSGRERVNEANDQSTQQDASTYLCACQRIRENEKKNHLEKGHPHTLGFTTVQFSKIILPTGHHVCILSVTVSALAQEGHPR